LEALASCAPYQQPRSAVLRGLFSFGSQLTQFVALLYIRLREVTALSFSQSSSSTIAAAVILRETVSWRRWLATVIGFAGVIVCCCRRVAKDLASSRSWH